MLTKNHETLAIEVKRHIEADAVVQGDYWSGSQGCFIGCLAHSDDAAALGDKYGLPLPLVRICESIFEALPADEAKAFFAAIPDAVGRDGKDLTRVHWAFLASELRALPQQDIIDAVIDGMDLLASGGVWAWDAARAAANAAYATYAAHAAARAAEAADTDDTDAHAAAYAAYASDAARAAAYAANAANAARAVYTVRAVHAADAADAAASDFAADATAARLRQRDTILRLIAEA